MQMCLSGLVMFPPRGPIRIIAAAVDGDTAAARRLFDGIEKVLAPRGFSQGGREWCPHITLVRSRVPIHGWRKGLSQEWQSKIAPFEARGFTLYESRLGHAGPIYHVVEQYR